MVVAGACRLAIALFRDDVVRADVIWSSGGFCYVSFMPLAGAPPNTCLTGHHVLPMCCFYIFLLAHLGDGLAIAIV